jgi:hypothetical protein
MNAEIRAEAALFPEKEYIKVLPLQCNLHSVLSSDDNLGETKIFFGGSLDFLPLLQKNVSPVNELLVDISL